MKKALLATILLLTGMIAVMFWGSTTVEPSQVETDYHNVYKAAYISATGEIEADNLQCPIPMSDRVKNYTGIQCVWSSLEMIGRWAEEPKLMNPPLTSRSNCKSYSGPDLVKTRLNSLGIKFEQTWGSRERGLAMIKKAMNERRGCLIGVPGHAMVLIHYDEVADVAKWVDNSDHSLKIHSSNIKAFHKMWTSWVVIVYADNDIIPQKTGWFARSIPIRNHDGSELPSDFIPLPRR